MAFATVHSYSPLASSNACTPLNTSSLSVNPYPSFSNLCLPRHSFSISSTLAFSRSPTRNTPLTSSSSPKKRNKANLIRNDGTEDEEDMDDETFEAMFSMLEEDLKNDDSPLDDNVDDISEEDHIKLQRELGESFGMADDYDSQVVNLDIGDANHRNDDEEMEEEDDIERPLKLKNWQLRRLASALKIGRRKTSIKNLAADICLDRAVVLEMLRDPPPYLVMMSATLPDAPKPTPLVQQTRPLIPPEEQPTVNLTPPSKEVKMPVHVMRHRWNSQKRLKKVHVDTLEKVYQKTKRPTNTMISSIVQVTNLPRKRVVKWFEDKRNEDGIPEQRVPYQRPS